MCEETRVRATCVSVRQRCLCKTSQHYHYYVRSPCNYVAQMHTEGNPSTTVTRACRGRRLERSSESQAAHQAKQDSLSLPILALPDRWDIFRCNLHPLSPQFCLDDIKRKRKRNRWSYRMQQCCSAFIHCICCCTQA